MIGALNRAFKEHFKGIKKNPPNSVTVPVFWDNAEEYAKVREDLREPVIAISIVLLEPDATREQQAANSGSSPGNGVPIFTAATVDGEGNLKTAYLQAYPKPIQVVYQVTIAAPKMGDVIAILKDAILRTGTLFTLATSVDIWGNGKPPISMNTKVVRETGTIEPQTDPGRRGFVAMMRFRAVNAWLFHGENGVRTETAWWNFDPDGDGSGTIGFDIFKRRDDFDVDEPEASETFPVEPD